MIPLIAVIQTLHQQGWRDGSSGKVLVSQCEDLSSNSISYIRSQLWWHRLEIPALGRQNQLGPWGLLVDLSLIEKATDSSEKLCLRKIM